MEDVKKPEFEKQCPYCKRKYKTTARRQKFCCPEHGKKYNLKKKVEKERYDRIKPVERLRVRCHAVGVETIKILCELGVREWKCECCGSLDKLEVHHKNLVWINNTPSNLALLCHKCHKKAHSKLKEELNEQGLLVEEYYEQSFQPFSKIINKEH